MTQSVGLPRPFQSEQFCSVTVIDAAYVKNLASVRAAKKRRRTEFSASHNWQPSAVGRHNHFSTIRYLLGRRSWKDVDHGNIFYSARRHSYVWRLRLVIRY